jgi:predicted nucleic acid-binding protein
VVIHSSATVAFFLGGEDAEWVEDVIAGEGLHAPHLLDLEVANVLRGLVRKRLVTDRRAWHVLEDLVELAIHRYSHLPFVERIWQLRSNLSAYDASYVALAEALEAPLVTIDRRLTAAPGLRTAVLVP